MKKLILLIPVLALTACHGKAGNATSDNNDGQPEVSIKSSSAIPVGVRILPEGATYDINQKPGHLVVIDFNATWCAPCRNFAPVFEEAAGQFAGQVEFISIDIDRHQELARQLGIRSIPFIVFIQPDGNIRSRVGFLPQEEFIKAINEYK